MHDDIESIKIISNLTPSITSFLEMFEFRLYHNFLTLLPPFYHIFTTPLPYLWQIILSSYKGERSITK